MEKDIFGGNCPLVRLGKKDMARAADVLTEAFDEDPYVRALFEGAAYDSEKARQLQLFSLKSGMKHGVVYASGEAMEGIIICFPPESVYLSDWQYISHGILSLKKSVHPGIIGTLDRYGSFMKALQKQYASFPHWYLYQVGVGSRFRGGHVASRMLAPFLEYFDCNRLPCYLETHNEINVPIYAHFGFTVAGTARLPGAETAQWCMLRMPQRIG